MGWRTVCLASTLPLLACNRMPVESEDGGDSGAESNASEASATSAPASSEAEAASDGGSMSSSTSDEATTWEPECVVDDDCPDCWQFCIDNVCEWLDCGIAQVQLEPTEPGGCIFDLKKPPNEPPEEDIWDLVEFQVGPHLIPGPEDMSPAECARGENDGWIWLDYGGVIQVCGPSCLLAQEEGSIEGIYPCPPCP